MKKAFTWAVAVLALLGQVSPVWADSSGDMMSMLDSMKQQMTKMQQTIDQQNARIQQLESKPAMEMQPSGAAQAAAPATISDADFQKGKIYNLQTTGLADLGWCFRLCQYYKCR